MKRTFIAVKVEPSAELLHCAGELKKALMAESIKWVNLSDTHITLVFLGDTEEKRIPELTSILETACSEFAQFEFSIAGTGVFKNMNDPKVIWAGIRSSGELEKLNGKIASALKESGFNIDEKPFRPHLTLGRIRSVRNTGTLKNALESCREKEFQKVTVGDVILFESILLQTGPLYKPLKKIRLGHKHRP